nr:hypothetical protein [Cytophagales bacterium]
MHNHALKFLLIFSFISCQTSTVEVTDENAYAKGTFGFDLQFLAAHDSLVILKNGKSQLIISPGFQGKVFTSTAEGMEGVSFGWLNYEAIASGEIAPHINAYGGEDRFWLGPEGGQYSLFFPPKSEMVFENWQTPSAIDSESWTLLGATETSARLTKSLQLTNYLGTSLEAEVDRVINLLSEADVQRLLGLQIGKSVSWVGFESVNTLRNVGDKSWEEESGTMCIWILGMFNPTDASTVVIPYVTGDELELGSVATTDYFGQIPPDRISMQDGILYFKGDGKQRGKLGVSPARAMGLAGSYDAENRVLTVVQYDQAEIGSLYMNQVWELQDEPYAGDVINSYNDGPLENGDQMGPFYELETVSPAAFLDPGQQIVHTHRTFHFVGDEAELAVFAERLFGVSLEKIASVFN